MYNVWFIIIRLEYVFIIVIALLECALFLYGIVIRKKSIIPYILVI